MIKHLNYVPVTYTFEPFHEKPNNNPDGHVSPPVDFINIYLYKTECVGADKPARTA